MIKLLFFSFLKGELEGKVYGHYLKSSSKKSIYLYSEEENSYVLIDSLTNYKILGGFNIKDSKFSIDEKK